MTANSPQTGTTEWLRPGFFTVDAQTLTDADVPLAVAQKWTEVGFKPDDAIEYIDKNVPPTQPTSATGESNLGRSAQRAPDTRSKFAPWQKDGSEFRRLVTSEPARRTTSTSCASTALALMTEAKRSSWEKTMPISASATVQAKISSE
ncbi:hypothetical protein PXH78_31865 [Mycolicibacterium smegmatis]|nr:hypothetical protein [Mycolicibacterium smegmatis]MDF1903575.1 hypothetical protein [Mycolicibacterium smegmatis]MDF1910101.1 hypothetical protein [Mycolicibacterium smegmatis]MDF1921944.1 hypothetical protein [Mycolicibacterium smegmatis]MDF1928466.1 hypothetical protein [Mycolicibacterium smegmatis]UAK53489.1 hypothetical protein K8P01_23200 [Mycolicibacterium smegmatis]